MLDMNNNGKSLENWISDAAKPRGLPPVYPRTDADAGGT